SPEAAFSRPLNEADVAATHDRCCGKHPCWRRFEGGAPQKSGGFLDGAGGACEACAELLDAARFDDARLCAGIEGVRFGRDFTLEKRIGLAVDLGGFAAVQGRTRNERVAGLLVEKNDFAVFGVNAFFHGGFLWACWGRRSVSKKALLSHVSKVTRKFSM